MNEDIMRQAGLGKYVDLVKAGKCPTCGNAIVGFRDELSQREHAISGMCQVCQDSVFNQPKETEDE